MLRFLADENFDNRVLRGLLLREPLIDIIRVQDSQIAGSGDPAVLEWAAVHDRILLSHDVATIPLYARQRMEAGQQMSGVFVVPDRMPIGQAIEELLIAALCSASHEWVGVVQWFPL